MARQQKENGKGQVQQKEKHIMKIVRSKLMSYLPAHEKAVTILPSPKQEGLSLMSTSKQLNLMS